MKTWSVIGLLFAALGFAAIPISPQVTSRGVELSVDHAQAVTYGHYRRVYRRTYRRGYRRSYWGVYGGPYYAPYYSRYYYSRYYYSPYYYGRRYGYY